MQADAGDVVTRSELELDERLAELADADLLALRLAAQVLAHKAALVGRPLVGRWFGELERAVDFALARRGVGLVLGQPAAPSLPADASAEDRRLVVEHLGLLAGNDRLAEALRRLCADLQATIEPLD
ncbi:MAG TPA: hypothetical protein VH741_05430 [Candidatus Limnocylindrales bacterium]